MHEEKAILILMDDNKRFQGEAYAKETPNKPQSH
jgi:hypothetical protein